MQHAAANRRRGIEVVPGGGFEPTATVYYRGDAVGVVKQTGAGEWVACGRPYPRLDAAVLVTTAKHILTGP